MVLLLAFEGCGGNEDGNGGGRDYVGRWQASVRNGFQTQTVTYDISHISGNKYLIGVEIDGQKQAETIKAVFEKNTFRVRPYNDEAVPDGKNRMILQGMDFKRVE